MSEHNYASYVCILTAELQVYHVVYFNAQLYFCVVSFVSFVVTTSHCSFVQTVYIHDFGNLIKLL